MKGFVGKLNKMQIFLKNHTFCCHALIDKFNLLPKLTHIAQKIWCQLKICISNLHTREFNTENFIDDFNTKQTNRGPEGEGYLDRDRRYLISKYYTLKYFLLLHTHS